MYQCVLDLDHPERLPRYVTRTSEGVLIHGPRPRRLGLHDFSGPPPDREASVTREEVEGVLRRISGADVRVTAIEQANRWTDITRLVDTYRQGRVLLAGDAAHVHPPVGGQGLSLGLVDAANLGCGACRRRSRRQAPQPARQLHARAAAGGRGRPG